MRQPTLVKAHPLRKRSPQPGIHCVGPAITTGSIRDQVNIALNDLSEANSLL